MRAPDSVDRRSARRVLRIAAAVLVCALVGWAAYGWARRFAGRDWYEDPHGPVFVSADGRTLLFAYGPAEMSGEMASCFSPISFDLSVQPHAASVAVRFHVHQAPGQTHADGSCSQPVGFPLALGRPLGARTLTDSHGRPLPVLDGQRVPQLKDPRLTEPFGPIPCVVQQRGQAPGYCTGPLALWHGYTDSAQRVTWDFYQRPATGPGTAPPRASNPPSRWRAATNGAPADCYTLGADLWSLWWRQGGYELTLVLASSGRPTPVPSDTAACASLAKETGFVR
ncbi:hypothetical protein [Streptacidiphilus anmyonensis]|uniref:hypothetical protein n=1 Tax=Streptacidiphilus anmyonensis TaxID=405782 RepID=UPI000A9E0EB7|nr:hypothetical protein [Streptacidiphilus anmyonensis]